MSDQHEFVAVRIAVLTVSDTRTLEDDKSGDTLVERLTDAGHVLAARGIERDDRGAIVAHLRRWIADPAIDVILTTGGTGLTGRDVTVEAHRDVYEKEIEAFATVFTMVSLGKIGTSAVQSRACGGVAGGKGMACGGQALNQGVAGRVIRRRAGVADGQDRDADGQEVAGFVDAGH